MKPQLINKEIKIEEGDVITCISTQVHATFQTIFVHIKRADQACNKCGYGDTFPIVTNYTYKNMNDLTHDRQILESMVK